MAISVGDRIPDVTLRTISAEGPAAVQGTDVLAPAGWCCSRCPERRSTPTCSDHHLPGFVLQADDLADKGVETSRCVAVNDPFVMGAWSEAQSTDGKVLMLSDGNGDRGDDGNRLDGGGVRSGAPGRSATPPSSRTAWSPS